MQVVFHARIEQEKGGFTHDDVADGVCKKLVLRHPHVFGTVQVSGSDEVLDNWEKIKRREKSQETVTDSLNAVARTLPARWRAEKLQKKAAKAGFEWLNVGQAVDKAYEELGELREAIDAKGPAEVEEELGDLLLVAADIARFSHIDPEVALHKACEKLIRRFSALEKLVAADGKDMTALPFEELDGYYERAKELSENEQG
jgi:tetrapyrrole methylase family protein/MazG family protein